MTRHMHSIDIERNINDLIRWGLSRADAVAIRRSAAALHRWFELECGTGEGLIQQNEDTGVWTMHRDTGRGYDTKGYEISDGETRHRKQLARIMSNYPALEAYVQTDPRGCPVYICRKGDARADLYALRGCPVIV